MATRYARLDESQQHRSSRTVLTTASAWNTHENTISGTTNCNNCDACRTAAEYLRQQRHHPRAQDHREELRNYRLSRYYNSEDDYDDSSRSCSTGSCSLCAAAEHGGLEVNGDGGGGRPVAHAASPAGIPPQELSATTLSFAVGDDGRRMAAGSAAGLKASYRKVPVPLSTVHHHYQESPRFQARSVTASGSNVARNASSQFPKDNPPVSIEFTAETGDSICDRNIRGNNSHTSRYYDDNEIGVFSIHGASGYGDRNGVVVLINDPVTKHRRPDDINTRIEPVDDNHNSVCFNNDSAASLVPSSSLSSFAIFRPDNDIRATSNSVSVVQLTAPTMPGSNRTKNARPIADNSQKLTSAGRENPAKPKRLTTRPTAETNEVEFTGGITGMYELLSVTQI